MKSTIHTLDLIIKNFEKGLIKPNDPISMEWFAIEMMRVIEDLEKQTENEYVKIKFVELHNKFEILAKIFNTLSKKEA